jgi:hypothetical protein
LLPTSGIHSPKEDSTDTLMFTPGNRVRPAVLADSRVHALKTRVFIGQHGT